ncbi:alpha/beta-type small acid-soluble spore protein [Alicyclobacillus dauci]|uniref:Alpha/beta-type small acid-soluble spore protein n=1 Tax=Alicyclobacillus dauci TaxID=1475485 RepID=A0ABY6Z8D8_9BACL|nr:alpha/beta-type small acid-soluble spore protein [Alicyclobacillus dauci]WAH38526.1 alpha/beta-type small acid-soluble spore protein [Alicyclobacillus dauci]
MSDNREQRDNLVPTIGPNGQLRVVEGMNYAQRKSPAKMVADKLNVPYNEDGDNGNLTTREAGKIGGHIGGPMVRKLVYLAREEMAKQHVNQLIQSQKK